MPVGPVPAPGQAGDMGVGVTKGGGGHLAAGVVWVVAVVRVQGLQEDPVSDGARGAAGLVQHGQDAPVGPLHQLHDGGIVEILHLAQSEQGSS